jgi:hypothetical protein
VVRLEQRLRSEVTERLLEIGRRNDVGEHHRDLPEVVLLLETLERLPARSGG